MASSVVPPYIIWRGKNSPDMDMTKFKVILCLSVKPLIDTDFTPQEAIVPLPTELYDDGVWSELSMRSCGMAYFLITLLIS